MEKNHEINSNKDTVASIKKTKLRKRFINTFIGIILAIYTIITIIPFYFLFVRSFVSINDATELHLWPLKAQEVNLGTLTYGNAATYLSIDLQQFKKDMGIDDYIEPYSTFKDISKEFNIPEKRIKKYLDPYAKYNGWSTFNNVINFLYLDYSR